MGFVRVPEIEIIELPPPVSEKILIIGGERGHNPVNVHDQRREARDDLALPPPFRIDHRLKRFLHLWLGIA